MRIPTSYGMSMKLAFNSERCPNRNSLLRYIVGTDLVVCGSMWKGLFVVKFWSNCTAHLPLKYIAFTRTNAVAGVILPGKNNCFTISDEINVKNLLYGQFLFIEYQ